MENAVSTFGKDTPIGRPAVNGAAGIFVPAAGYERDMPATIKNGAGIVGFGNPDGTLTIYFESNRFDEAKLHKWESKVRQSYDKMVNHAPTVSRMNMAADMLEQVGIIDGAGINIEHPASLQRWLTHCKVMDTAPAQTMIAWRS